MEAVVVVGSFAGIVRGQSRFLELRARREEDRRGSAKSREETDMDNDDTALRPFKEWAAFSPGQLKQDIEDAWQARPADSPPYDVVIQVDGNNPLSGYRVILRPAR